MRPLTTMLCAAALFWAHAYGQPPQSQRHFMRHAIVQHKAGLATVVADAPRPLFQTITALRKEYGWRINYEQPPYFSQYDLTDDTSPEWRASHPFAKGVTIPAGGSFRSTFSERQSVYGRAGEKKILQKVVSDYNKTSNPGRFEVLSNPDGGYSIVGISLRTANGSLAHVSPILDTRISLSTSKRSAAETATLILNALSVKTGNKMVSGVMPLNLMTQTQVEIGGNNVPARALLLQTLDATGHALVYNIMHDADSNSYSLGIFGTVRAIRDRPGETGSVPVGRNMR